MSPPTDPHHRTDRRPRRARRLALGLAVSLLAPSAVACVGQRGNNDGPKRPGEPNPAQPYESERQELEQDSQRG